MNGEMSVDHLQRQTDRPVPNKQHRESHSLKELHKRKRVFSFLRSFLRGVEFPSKLLLVVTLITHKKNEVTRYLPASFLHSLCVGWRNLVRVSLIFAIIVSFMLFT